MLLIKRLCICIFLSGTLSATAQGLLETIFYKPPASVLVPSEYYDLEKRKSMIEEMKTNDGHTFDEKNGYLEYVSYQCPFQMCYWTLKHGSGNEEYKYQLVAVVPGCYGKPWFFTYSNGQMDISHISVIESFNSLLFFKDNATMGKIKDYKEHYAFSLPRKGLNITVSYTTLYSEQPGKELLKGDMIDFIYNNGDFTMSAPYFAKK